MHRIKDSRLREQRQINHTAPLTISIGDEVSLIRMPYGRRELCSNHPEFLSTRVKSPELTGYRSCRY